MSIVALKRKSLTQYGRGHVDAKGVFSLNGTTRHPPPTLGRTTYGTPMRGPAPMGHGCGKRCRVPGRFARVCGESYPVVVHNTCETVQTAVHPSVKNSRLDTLHLGINPVVKRSDKDISSHTDAQRVVVRHEVDLTQKCPPFYKDVGPLPYRDYLILRTTTCIANNP